MPHKELLHSAGGHGAQPTEREERMNPDTLLLELEARHAHLCEELAALERALRELRVAAEVCPQCGGTGERWVRGGLYGELQRRSCPSGCAPLMPRN